ncbi:MAG: ParB/RepB/Spo0J family partition protein [Clostridia bacterium]|nr:ParB/RepB/Spo0J family partition protein [Clostridia bacterium]
MFWGKIKEISRIIREIDVDTILVPEGRIRQVRSDDSLTALADSIREHGILEPILVRRDPSSSRDRPRYLLIAGERRLRAAQILSMPTVPCVSMDTSEIDAAVIAIVENLHREDLNLFEEAAAIASLIHLSGMTQEQCARRLSVSQSYIANKLRLLKLTEEERELMLRNSLTERHGRALLRIESPDERRRVLGVMIDRMMNVAAAEEYVESLLCAQSRAEEILARQKPDQKKKLIIRDIRIFYNSIDNAVDIIKKSGIPVESSRRETDDGTLISILLPKAPLTAEQTVGSKQAG